MHMLLITDLTERIPEYILVPDTKEIRDYLFTLTRRKGRQEMLTQIRRMNYDHMEGPVEHVVDEGLDTLDSTDMRFGGRADIAEPHKAYLLSLCSTVRSHSVVRIMEIADSLGADRITEVMAEES